MNVLAICGAANKSRNTATMLKSAFDGAIGVPGAAGRNQASLPRRSAVYRRAER